MDISVHTLRLSAFGAIVGLALVTAGRPVRAEEQKTADSKESEEPDLQKQARRARSGAGVVVDGWQVRDLPEVPGGSDSETPLYQAWFQKGLDLHLALENSVGFYRRKQEAGGDRVDTYIVPQFTVVKFYPFTRPEDKVEPFFAAGGGLSIGIDDKEITTGGGLLNSPSTENETNVVVGFGVKGGTGMEWRFSKAVGLRLGGEYQWIRFTEEVGGLRTYQGWACRSASRIGSSTSRQSCSEALYLQGAPPAGGHLEVGSCSLIHVARHGSLSRLLVGWILQPN